MKIGIQTWGSEGDVRPFLALAAGLRAAGDEVTLVVTHVANKDYAAPGARFDVPVRQAGRISADRAKHAAAALSGETDMLRQVECILRDLFAPAAADMLAEAKRLCEENELVIGHSLVHPLRTAAERSGRPHVSVFLAPLLPSSAFPPPGIPNLGRILNGLLWKAGGALMDRRLLPPINAMRRSEGLPPVKSAMGDVFLSPRLNLIASSPSLFPPPPDWSASVRICGAFHLPGEGINAALPAELLRFLETGTPPVYMTIGSMSIADPVFPDTIRLFASAARLARCRAIIQTEGQAVGPAADQRDILFLDNAEHQLVFPRCAAVVHHGGAGTTHSASRAGVPSVVVEHVTDQAFWGGVLHRAGIAPQTLHRRNVTAARLAGAIREALDSPTMRDRAREMGERMRQEDGVLRAVELIEQQHVR